MSSTISVAPACSASDESGSGRVAAWSSPELEQGHPVGDLRDGDGLDVTGGQPLGLQQPVGDVLDDRTL